MHPDARQGSEYDILCVMRLVGATNHRDDIVCVYDGDIEPVEIANHRTFIWDPDGDYAHHTPEAYLWMLPDLLEMADQGELSFSCDMADGAKISCTEGDYCTVRVVPIRRAAKWRLVDMPYMNHRSWKMEF